MEVLEPGHDVNLAILQTHDPRLAEVGLLQQGKQGGEVGVAGHQAAHHVGGEQLLQRRGRELGGHEAVSGAGQGEDRGHGGDGHGEQHHGHPRAGGGHTGQQAGDGAHPPPQTSVGYTNLSL